jgi:Uma2 family endonuclease
MGSPPQTLITAEQFYQLPQEEGREFELLDGEVIEIPSASPRHNVLLSIWIELLSPALRGRGRAIPETDFSDGRYTTLRPDLAILLGEKFTGLNLDKLPVTTAPDIVIEIVSPSESLFRVNRRIDSFLRFGVREVWVVDPQNRQIYLHTEKDVIRLRSGGTVSSPLLPGWSIPVDQVFEI